MGHATTCDQIRSQEPRVGEGYEDRREATVIYHIGGRDYIDLFGGAAAYLFIYSGFFISLINFINVPLATVLAIGGAVIIIILIICSVIAHAREGV